MGSLKNRVDREGEDLGIGVEGAETEASGAGAGNDTRPDGAEMGDGAE